MKEVPWTTHRSPGAPCPYLEGRTFVQEYFLARGMDGETWSVLLSQGWRRFGTFFFRPRCPSCQACTPLRLPVRDLEYSKSLRKVWNKNADVKFSLEPLTWSPELFEVYASHGSHRFGEEPDNEHFRDTFFAPGAPGVLTTYRIGDHLAAAGFTDQAAQALSSVYFVYRPEESSRSLGTYSVLRECKLAADLGLDWYYLGYWVPGNPRMAYKHRFQPRQLFDWATDEWRDDNS